MSVLDYFTRVELGPLDGEQCCLLVLLSPLSALAKAAIKWRGVGAWLSGGGVGALAPTPSCFAVTGVQVFRNTGGKDRSVLRFQQQINL
eukprot:3677841-Amphidinium_carterae.1